MEHCTLLLSTATARARDRFDRSEDICISQMNCNCTAIIAFSSTLLHRIAHTHTHTLSTMKESKLNSWKSRGKFFLFCIGGCTAPVSDNIEIPSGQFSQFIVYSFRRRLGRLLLCQLLLLSFYQQHINWNRELHPSFSFSWFLFSGHLRRWVDVRWQLTGRPSRLHSGRRISCKNYTLNRVDRAY